MSPWTAKLLSASPGSTITLDIKTYIAAIYIIVSYSIAVLDVLPDNSFVRTPPAFKMSVKEYKKPLHPCILPALSMHLFGGNFAKTILSFHAMYRPPSH
jgi:hypothetical protein